MSGENVSDKQDMMEQKGILGKLMVQGSLTVFTLIVVIIIL